MSKRPEDKDDDDEEEEDEEVDEQEDVSRLFVSSLTPGLSLLCFIGGGRR